MSEPLIKTPCAFGDNGNFLLERELGSGGMGGVYMGRDKMLDRPVAVKVMLKEYGSDAEFVEKFKKEAQSAARLIHPNIAQIYSYGISDGMPYIAMELVAGGSLYSVMNANPGKTDIPRVIKICQQVAQALRCSADQGVVHGDIKPENILLDANGNAKIVDFGLAAMQKDTDEIWGTPYYISPEKVKKEPVDFRADMYSLGGTLYHALTGVAPFEGEDSVAVVKKRFESVPRRPSEIRPEITPAIDALVMKMLALGKEDRYPSVEALLEAFKGVLTTGLSAATASRQVAAGGAKRMTNVRGGRRVTSARRPATVQTSEKVAEAEEDEKGGNLGLKVVGVVLGAILLVGGVIGGLVWYKVSAKNARIAEEQAQIASETEKARGAIRDTLASAVKFANDCDALAARTVEECQKPTDELRKIIHPMELGALLKPSPSKELLDAIASTNAVQKSETVQKDRKASMEKLSKNAGEENERQKPSAVEKAKPDDPSQQVVLTMNDLWNRAYSCQASAIRIRQAVHKILEKGKEADAITGKSRENMTRIGDISKSLVDMFEQVKGSKDVENIRKGISFIKAKGAKTVEQTVKRLRIEKLEAARKAKADAAAAAEKAHQEKMMADRKALVEKETADAKSTFESIVNQGCIRQLDWKNALRQLNVACEGFKTAEGQLAAELERRKINDMKLMHDIFVSNLKGYVFRGKLKGAEVIDVNANELTLVKADKKTKTKISWQKFYRDYPGNLRDIINHFIVNTRQHDSKFRISSSRKWADAMTGAALTIRLVCSEVAGAATWAAKLATDAVRGLPDYRSTAQSIFPDVKFDEDAKED